MIMGFRFLVFWARGFFFGFLGEVGQSALCFLVGRLSKFLQLSAGIQSCRGNLFNLIVIIISYLPFDFFYGSELLLSFGHYCEYCGLCDEEFLVYFFYVVFGLL